MFQARSEWRHIRLIFDHAEGPLIRFAYSLSWVLCGNYHNCCAKHACLYGWRRDVSVCRERGILTPNPINAGWMAGPAEGEGGYRHEEGEGCWSNHWHSSGSTQLQPPGAPQPPSTTTFSHQLRLISGEWELQQENDDFSHKCLFNVTIPRFSWLVLYLQGSLTFSFSLWQTGEIQICVLNWC